MRALIVLLTGILSIPAAFLPFGPLTAIVLGFMSVGFAAPVKHDRRAKLGMLFALVGIVLAFILLASTLPS